MSPSFFSPSFNNNLLQYTGINPPQSSSRKRKRSESDQDDVLDDHSPELDCSSNSTGSPEDVSAPSPHLRAQHRANERHLNTGILGKNFPHVKPRQNEDSVAGDNSELHDALGDAKLRMLFQNRQYIKDGLVHDVSSSTGFRRQHVAALTTILHRGILEGDYVRAGRAWGILLRIEVKGRFMDVRTSDQWGLGAEILCRRRSQPIEKTSNQRRSLIFEDNSRKQPLFTSEQWFSSEGFDLARSYFERLILQHPYRKQFRSAVGALDFYPAMFGLWIYSEQERYELSLKSFREADAKLTQELSEPEHTGKGDPSTHSHTTTHSEEKRIKKAYLRRGQQIAARLNELLASPPFSDNRRLQDLKTMVNRWIGDF